MFKQKFRELFCQEYSWILANVFELVICMLNKWPMKHSALAVNPLQPISFRFPPSSTFAFCHLYQHFTVVGRTPSISFIFHGPYALKLRTMGKQTGVSSWSMIHSNWTSSLRGHAAAFNPRGMFLRIDDEEKVFRGGDMRGLGETDDRLDFTLRAIQFRATLSKS